MVLDIDLNNGDIETPPIEKTREEIVVNKPRKKKKGFLRFFIFFLLFLFLGGIGFAIWKGYIISEKVGFKFNAASLISNKTPELEKDSKGQYTSVLLVGVDSRKGDDISNTDTIMVASYNYETNNIQLISIPRDFHVEVDKQARLFQRINSVYAREERKQKNGGGFEGLKRSITEVTGLEIQYHALVDFKAFEEIIDSLGGVNVNVENSFTDYRYPSGVKYKTVSFQAGPQVMDGKTALEYARSRHSMQNNEGSDYARARRQQKVIIAIQNKISQSDALNDPKILIDMLSSIVNNIKISEFTVTDVQAGLDLLKKFNEENGKSYSFVLDPLAGGGQLVEKVFVPSGAFAIGPKEGLGKYDKIHEYIQLARKKPYLYSNNPRVFVYDIGIGYKETTEKVKEIKQHYPYINIIQSRSILKDQEGNYVYSDNDKYKESINDFAQYLKTENKEKPDFVKSNLNPDAIIILLGKEIEKTEEN